VKLPMGMGWSVCQCAHIHYGGCVWNDYMPNSKFEGIVWTIIIGCMYSLVQSLWAQNPGYLC